MPGPRVYAVPLQVALLYCLSWCAIDRCREPMMLQVPAGHGRCSGSSDANLHLSTYRREADPGVTLLEHRPLCPTEGEPVGAVVALTTLGDGVIVGSGPNDRAGAVG